MSIIQDQDTLMWVEGVTNLDDICTKEVLPSTTTFCKALEQLDFRPFVQIDDWKMYKLDHFDHSYNQYYLQINQHTHRARVVIVFKRYQKDKVQIYADNESPNLKNIKENSHVIQKTHYKKSIEIGTTLTTEEYTKITKMTFQNFLLSL